MSQVGCIPITLVLGRVETMGWMGFWDGVMCDGGVVVVVVKTGSMRNQGGFQDGLMMNERWVR